MSDFIGFVCDTCGNVWPLSHRTRVTMRFEQNEYCSLGVYTKDACPNCIVPPFDWNPVPTRKRRIVADITAEPTGDSSPQG